MADVNLSFPLDLCIIQGEFLKNLQVANFYIGLNSKYEDFKIRKVTFEASKVHVKVVNIVNKTGETVALSYPHGATVSPNTISAINATKRGWLFRLMINEYPITIDYEFKINNDFFPKCSKCQECVLKSDYASMGLIAPHSHHSMTTYFCHQHHHQSQPEPQQKVFMIPLQVVATEFHYSIHSEVLDFEKLKFQNEIYHCANCLQPLALKTNSELINFYRHALHNYSLKELIKQLTTSSNQIRFNRKESEEVLLLWLLDRNLLVFSNVNKSGRSVFKILYKMERKSGKEENICEVDEHFFSYLIGYLVRLTEELPIAWRCFNQFSIALI